MRTPGTGITIGRCIYCGTTQGRLTREHVIPYGLNGELVLEQASCDACARITSAFEETVLKRMLGPVRAALGFRTRRKKKRPTVLPVQIDRGWGWQTEDVALLDYPAVIALPGFPMPAVLTGRPLAPDAEVLIDQMHSATFPHQLARLAQGRVLAPEIRVRGSMQYDPTDFARMLAKIGYGVAVAEHGVDAFAEVFVAPLILGRQKDAARWVGTWDGIPRNRAPLLHSVVTVLHGDRVHAHVRLFAGFGGPEYLVVVGRLKNGDLPAGENRG